ncbi:receptor-like protein 12 [Humulus lupulus]|uniref:receptor-like protein 12 n=1 Tax=Humulus lupulus TaxID=3486 RepID=UPI002B4012C6|nr:receptor-like protein 12 [Humulus lupulus]
MCSSAKSLQILQLSNCSFKGSSNSAMLTNLTQLVELSFLGIDSNNFGGQIPLFFLNLQQLIVLDLSRNNFVGKIPEFPKANSSQSPLQLNLRALFISDNLLSESIPSWKIPCKSLVYVDLRSNMIQGPLPTVPPSVTIFFISNNALFGEIPSTYCNLNLHSNNLSGEIPHDMFEKLTMLRSLHLSNNHLYGSLPHSLRSCQSLEVLDVGNNKINDTFPHWLEDLPMLRVLVLKSNRFHDLSSNGLVGVIPTKMAILTQLSNLNLLHNKLVGEIPRGNQFDTFNKDSYSGNLELCGPPVSKSCTSGETQPDDDDDEDDDGVFDWKIVMMGYGCGIILGISVGYMVLYSRWFDYWLNKKVREKRMS